MTLPAEKCVCAGWSARSCAAFSGRTAQSREGKLLALIDSSGYLEIAIREGDAAAALGLGRGAPVALWVGA